MLEVLGLKVGDTVTFDIQFDERKQKNCARNVVGGTGPPKPPEPDATEQQWGFLGSSAAMSGHKERSRLQSLFKLIYRSV